MIVIFRLKAQLFSCMQQTLSRCPAGQTLMEQNGYDHSTLTSGIDVLCHNVNGKLSTYNFEFNTLINKLIKKIANFANTTISSMLKK